MAHKFADVDCSRGAPMGRRTVGALDKTTPRSISLFRVRLDSGGYDNGGAYWGVAYNGNRLYCAMDANGDMQFTRATHREKAALILGLTNKDLKQRLVEPVSYGMAVLEGRAPMPDGVYPTQVVAWLEAHGVAVGGGCALHEQMVGRLRASGYEVGPRNPKAQPGLIGAYSVCHATDRLGYAIVGDDLHVLVAKAHAHVFGG